MEGASVVVVGSCMVDFVSYADRLPKEGETVHGTRFVTNFGGKGANQCVAAAKLGGRTNLVAKVGDDVWADKYIDNLRESNVDTKHVRKVTNSASGIAQIVVSEGGANQIVIVPGANSSLALTDVVAASNVISEAAVVVCQLETSIDVAIAACKLCKGISILNGAPALSEFPKQLLTVPTIFCVNESEAEIFSGLKVQSVNDGKHAITALLNKGCNSVILTLGSEGALYAHKDNPNEFLHVMSPKVKSVDSTGAGDAFIGALAFLLANRRDLTMARAIEIACIVAADTVTRPGTQISFPGPEVLNYV